MEVGAIVIEQGSTWTRAGYAGEDCPKAILPTTYGELPDGTRVYGDLQINCPRAGMELKNPMEDGQVYDWEATRGLWEAIFRDHLRVDPGEHPLILVEPWWNSGRNRELAMQLAFEVFNVPAFFIAKSAVCSAFANGRPSALIVEVGSAVASVTPVWEGHALKKGAIRQGLAGDHVSRQLRSYFGRQGISITPHYLIAHKETVEAGHPARFQRKQYDGITSSFHTYQEERVLHEFKEGVCQVLEGEYSEGAAASRCGQAFEFPDGFNRTFTIEKYRAPEVLFKPSLSSPDAPAPADAVGLAQMIFNSVSACDVDIRGHLLSHIIVSGGTSLTMGLMDRIHTELSRLAPGAKVRAFASGQSVERKNCGWIGGSILGSLSGFHSMWIGREEYDEAGDRASLIAKRCR